jgi:hypothetical protein
MALVVEGVESLNGGVNGSFLIRAILPRYQVRAVRGRWEDRVGRGIGGFLNGPGVDSALK